MDASMATNGEQYAAAYPSHDVPADQKNTEWGKNYAKAMWNDWQYSVPRTIFFNKADKYEEIRMYMQGKQPINKYKKLLGVDEQTNETFMVLDWSVRPVVVKYRDIAISRLIQQEYGIVATPIDMQAKDELQAYYAKAKADIAVKKLLSQVNQNLASHPVVMGQPNDPKDQEELDMRINFGEQFNRSKDAELAIQLGLYENNSQELRKEWFGSLFDCAVAGYYEWLDKNDRPKVRQINAENVITNYCRFADFRDLVQAGEMVDVAVVDVGALTDETGNKVFDGEQMKEIEGAAGKWSNTSLIGRSTNYFRGYDKFHVKVLDCEFYSWNNIYYNERVDSRGNQRWYKENDRQSEKGRRKYKGKRVKVVYQVKWIVGTEYAYDFRLKDDQKRTVGLKTKAETSLSYKFYATNFYEMRSLSMGERLIPFADDYQMTWYRIQNFKARMVPSGWWIDLDALENVALNKGGDNMTPKQLLQMFLDTGVLVGRSKEVMGDNINYKPIIPIQNSIAQELAGLYQDLLQNIQGIESIIGFNEITAGGNANPKMLVPGYDNANASTNNALYQLQFGEKTLMGWLAKDMLVRMQQAVRKGGVDGFAPALNTNTLQFLSVDNSIGSRDYGIMLEEKVTDDQKQFIMQNMKQDIMNGTLDQSDAIMILNTYNLKQAEQMLAYKVKKNKEMMQQQQMQNQQMTIQGQQQSAQQSQQSAIQLEQMQHQNKMQQTLLEKQWDYKIAQLKVGGATQNTQSTNQTKLASHVITEQNKENMQRRDMLHDNFQQQQEMQNQQPEPAQQ